MSGSVRVSRWPGSLANSGVVALRSAVVLSDSDELGVAEFGSFVKAAQQLHLTQTALTRRIQKLESLLDTRLLDRTTRKVELTATGRDFLPQARHLVLDAKRTLQRVRDKTQIGGGHFTLACVPSLTTHVLPELIRAYALQCPGNSLRLLDASSHEVRASVLDGQAELGIAINGEPHAELQEMALFEDPLTLLCPMPHPLQNKRTVSWTDLQNVDLIVVSSFMATRMFLDYQLDQRGIRLSGHYEVQHHATAINLVAAGVGCAVLPYLLPGLSGTPSMDSGASRAGFGSRGARPSSWRSFMSSLARGLAAVRSLSP